MLIILCLQIIHFPPALCLGSEENCNLHIFVPSAGVRHCFYDISCLYNIKKYKNYKVTFTQGIVNEWTRCFSGRNLRNPMRKYHISPIIQSLAVVKHFCHAKASVLVVLVDHICGPHLTIYYRKAGRLMHELVISTEILPLGYIRLPSDSHRCHGDSPLHVQSLL